MNKNEDLEIVGLFIFKDFMMNYKKLKRYPRYTSYPIYPFWNKDFQEKDIKEKIAPMTKDVDLYIHIPFCKKPCFYCGCNKIITKQGGKELEYVHYLLKEWDMYQKVIPHLKVRSIHFGGGTPTFLSAELLEKVLNHILGEKKCEISIEIDPRITTDEQIKVFKKFGATKFSMGIQDFSDEVQKVINRKQPADMVDKLVKTIRTYEVDEINFDLIYGLPAQSQKTIDDTLIAVEKINPDTISLFSYAHLPNVFPLQKRMEKQMNLTAEEKDKMYHYYKKQLIAYGYEQMGLDHFAKKESALYQAYKERAVGRNFMGYTTQKTSEVLGIGVSSISSINHYFYQNHKEIPDYYKSLDQGLFPIFNGHKKSREDEMMAKIIEEFMCYKTVDLENYLPLVKDKKDFFFQKLKKDYVDKGICTYTNGILKLENGKELFLRKICHFLDPYFPWEKSL